MGRAAVLLLAALTVLAVVTGAAGARLGAAELRGLEDALNAAVATAEKLTHAAVDAAAASAEAGSKAAERPVRVYQRRTGGEYHTVVALPGAKKEVVRKLGLAAADPATAPTEEGNPPQQSAFARALAASGVSHASVALGAGAEDRRVGGVVHAAGQPGARAARSHLEGGLSLGVAEVSTHDGGGTLGGLFTDADTRSRLFVVTNEHVMVGNSGTRVCQPDPQIKNGLLSLSKRFATQKTPARSLAPSLVETGGLVLHRSTCMPDKPTLPESDKTTRDPFEIGTKIGGVRRSASGERLGDDGRALAGHRQSGDVAISELPPDRRERARCSLRLIGDVAGRSAHGAGLTVLDSGEDALRALSLSKSGMRTHLTKGGSVALTNFVSSGVRHQISVTADSWPQFDSDTEYRRRSRRYAGKLVYNPPSEPRFFEALKASAKAAVSTAYDAFGVTGHGDADHERVFAALFRLGRVTAFSAQGDSGSWLVDSATREVVGMMSAGEWFAEAGVHGTAPAGKHHRDRLRKDLYWMALTDHTYANTIGAVEHVANEILAGAHTGPGDPPTVEVCTQRRRADRRLRMAVHFDSNSHRLPCHNGHFDCRGELRRLKELKADKCSHGGFYVACHASAAGDADRNLRLSKKRCDTVRKILAANGGGTVHTASFGEQRPEDSTDSGKEWSRAAAANRRAEVFCGRPDAVGESKQLSDWTVTANSVA